MNYIVDNNNLGDFNRKMKTGNMIVWYFAPWCGHCKHMESEWDKFISLKNSDPVLSKNLNCARVSDSMLPRLEDKYKGISGFPTIKFYRKGNETPTGEFQSDKERTSENFKEFSLNNLNSYQTAHRSMNNSMNNSIGLEENKKPKNKKLGSKKNRKKLKRGRTTTRRKRRKSKRNGGK